MRELLDICESLLIGKCVRWKDTIICRNNQIKIVEVADSTVLSRVCVNFYYLNIPKTTKERVSRMEKLVELPQMEITMMKDEAETIGVWLALAALGQESHRPDDLLCWPSGDYAWTFRAAKVGNPERRFG
jgi:hypothetical protein